MGKVMLVGAGCGQKELLTLKAKEAIANADCILYDHLLDPSILSFSKEACQHIYVGKQKGGHSLSQEQIERLLIKKAREFPLVVRLKGGDPYVFGRGGEEGRTLYRNRIDFEVVPGISSCIGGLSYAGIPITSRGEARGFRVYTAYTREQTVNPLDFHELAHTDDTIVFLMGKAQIESIVSAYQKEGVNKPIALISKAAFPDQRVLVGETDTILTKPYETLPTPLLIVIGDVIKQREALDWFSRRPLAGVRLFYPRLSSRDELCRPILELGAELDAPITYRLKRDERMLEGLRLDRYDVLVFTSVSAIRLFLEWMKKQRLDLRSLPSIGVVGEASALILEEQGIYPDWVGEGNVASLISILNEELDPSAHVLIPHSESNIEVFCTLEADFDLRVFYRLEAIPYMPLHQEYDIGIFTSAKAVETLKDHDLTIRQAIAIGPKTTRALQEAGFKQIIQTKESSYHSIIELLKGMKNV